MAESTNRGAVAFKSFLERHTVTKVAAAAALSVSDPTIHDWVTGAKRPRHEQRLRIDRWTNGDVPVSWWVTPDEAARVNAVQPFESTLPDDAA